MGKKLSGPRSATLAAIAALALFYVSGDWALYFLDRYGASPGTPFPIAVAASKFLASCLAFAFVCSTGREGLDPLDSLWLRLAFSFLLVADFLLTLLYPVLKALGPDSPDALVPASIVAFMAVQTCLIARHGRALAAPTGSGERDGKGGIPKPVAVGALALLAAGIPAVVAVAAVGKNPAPVMPTYGAYVILSLIVAWLASRTGFFPRANGRMIARGMTAFFLCDLSVGLGAATPLGTPFVWLFYTPALILLAASGVDFAQWATAS